MREFVITVNSTVDLPKEWLKERNVPVLPLKYTIDGQTYQDMEGLSAKEFFQKLREGHMSVTSQINPEEAREMMEPFLKEGKDLLHLAFSSGLSGTYNSMRIVEYGFGSKINAYSKCNVYSRFNYINSVISNRPSGSKTTNCNGDKFRIYRNSTSNRFTVWIWSNNRG